MAADVSARGAPPEVPGRGGQHRYTGTGILCGVASETYSRHLIRMARRQAGLTQTELAELAGTSQAAVSAYESGRRSPSVDTLVRILAATGMELRMRLAPPDTHTPALAAAEAVLPAEQLSAQRARQRARLDRHRTSA
jgi:transcriptional regulator with XRE-family HTH domain